MFAAWEHNKEEFVAKPWENSTSASAVYSHVDVSKQ